MDRAQALAEFTAHLSDYDDWEPVYLPRELLREISVSDLPAGVVVEVGVQHGSVVEVAWNGRLTRTGDGTLRPVIYHDIAPKWWPEAVGARFYLDLLHKCVLSKVGAVDGLAVDAFDDSNDVIIRLEYSFHVDGANLEDAFNNANRIQREIEFPAEQVLNDVTRALAVSADRVLQGHYTKESELVDRVEAAKSSADKGASLETLMSVLFENVPGFTVAGRNVDTDTEEIDLVVLNGSQDPIYSKDGPLVLVECKNWNAKAGRPEFSSLETRIMNRNNRCTLAFLVSWSGFAKTVKLEALRLSRERYMIVCLTGADVRRAALAGNFPEFLRQATLHALNA